MSRITKNIANAMASEIVIAAIAKDKEALAIRREAIGRRIISYVWAPYADTDFGTYAIAPRGLFHEVSAIQVRASVTAAILGFGTWDRLTEGWPAITIVIDKWVPVAAPEGRSLVNVSSINERLGLPAPTLEPAT